MSVRARVGLGRPRQQRDPLMCRRRRVVFGCWARCCSSRYGCVGEVWCGLHDIWCCKDALVVLFFRSRSVHYLSYYFTSVKGRTVCSVCGMYVSSCCNAQLRVAAWRSSYPIDEQPARRNGSCSLVRVFLVGRRAVIVRKTGYSFHQKMRGGGGGGGQKQPHRGGNCGIDEAEAREMDL